MMRLPKKIWLFGLPAVLLIGFAVLGVLFLKQRDTIAAQQRVIDAQTESAYRALSDDLYDLSVALSKMEAASSPASLSKSFSSSCCLEKAHITLAPERDSPVSRLVRSRVFWICLYLGMVILIIL